MDIDSEPGTTLPGRPFPSGQRPIPIGPAAMTHPSRPPEAPLTVLPDGSKMYRYFFEVDISNRVHELTDLEMLQHARTQMGFLERAGLREDSMRRIRDCRTRLRVTIDTNSASRLDALADCRMRMLTMTDMITDGMGWFPGLPWRATHFNVEVLYPRGR
jgi:hypothetical protein